MEINQPNKIYASSAMHTAEHLLNSQMVKHFNCKRSFSSHIEKKKSKCDYHFMFSPTPEDINTIEEAVNNIIKKHIDIKETFYPVNEVPEHINLEKLPDPEIKTIRVIKIGEFDECACIGEHVENTSEIGTFKIISYDYNDNILRIRFKVTKQ